MKGLALLPPDALSSIIAEACTAFSCVVYVNHMRISFADIFILSSLADAIALFSSRMHEKHPLEDYHNYYEGVLDNLEEIGVEVELYYGRAGNHHFFVNAGI